MNDKRIHPSWLIAVGSLGIVGGSTASLFVNSGFWSNTAWLLVALSLFAVSIAKRSISAIVLVFVAGICIG